MKEYVLCVFPSLCGKQQPPGTISIKVEEDISGGKLDQLRMYSFLPALNSLVLF